METSVIILAAGLGTRMKSKTAKVLHSAGGRTLVEHVVATARQVAPAERIAVVVGHQAEKVQTLLAPTGVQFALQSEQRGTGHAVMMAAGLLPEAGNLVILYGDAPLLSVGTLRRLIEARESSGAAATVLTTNLEDPSGYGRIIRNAAGEVEAIIEHRAATPEQRAITEINSGLYCFDAAPLWKHLNEIGTDNPAGEYYLTDIVAIFRAKGHKVSPFVLETADELLGINTRVELAEVDRVFRQRKVRELMLEGVTIEKPETVAIDVDVKIGRDTIVEAGVRLLGTTTIGEDCLIRAGAIIEDSKIADNVRVEPYTVINKSVIETGVSIGPFARLRFENHVGAGSHIGNFVELKKTTFGEGVKAGHLAYLGDASIGTDVNIGAGTITCNFDGEKKHRTNIGEKAFVGSNSTLVAPVEIGAESYIAAGSVITEPVPGKTLGIGRSRQTNKQGWKKRQRPTVASGE